MSSAWLLALFALLTWRWWLPVGRALLEDLRAASEEPGARPLPRTGAPLGPRPLAAESRVPPNRLLAFQGVRRRTAARRRWEAGFGRRGL